MEYSYSMSKAELTLCSTLGKLEFPAELTALALPLLVLIPRAPKYPPWRNLGQDVHSRSTGAVLLKAGSGIDRDCVTQLPSYHHHEL